MLQCNFTEYFTDRAEFPNFNEAQRGKKEMLWNQLSERPGTAAAGACGTSETM